MHKYILSIANAKKQQLYKAHNSQQGKYKQMKFLLHHIQGEVTFYQKRIAKSGDDTTVLG